jgi:hypothetical protein
VLQNVNFVATKLVGGEGRIEARYVIFEPQSIPSVRPGGSITTTVTVDVPSETAPDTYRGLIHAEPGGAWAVLELKVLPKPPEKVQPAAAA